MVQRLASDPSTYTAASVQGWGYPMSRLEALVADLYDAAAPHTYKKPPPYPRPFTAPRSTKRHGDVAGRTPEQVKAILREFGPSPIQGPV